jgi:hypothetical protein
MTALTVDAILSALAEVHTAEPPDIDQRTAAWWWGAQDEQIAWALCMCHTAAADPMAQSLYIAHVAEDLSRAREIKTWAYDVAQEIADEPHRHRKAVESYRLSWGHQAARDGVALALWPHLAECVYGYSQQARRLRCEPRAYLAIREGVLSRVRDTIAAFKYDLDSVAKSSYSRDFIERHRAGALRRGEQCATLTRAWGVS